MFIILLRLRPLLTVHEAIKIYREKNQNKTKLNLTTKPEKIVNFLQTTSVIILENVWFIFRKFSVSRTNRRNHGKLLRSTSFRPVQRDEKMPDSLQEGTVDFARGWKSRAKLLPERHENRDPEASSLLGLQVSNGERRGFEVSFKRFETLNLFRNKIKPNRTSGGKHAKALETFKPTTTTTENMEIKSLVELISNSDLPFVGLDKVQVNSPTFENKTLNSILMDILFF